MIEAIETIEQTDTEADRALAGRIAAILRRQRFDLSNEKITQAGIAAALNAAGIEAAREVRLDSTNVIDVLVGRVGIEVKIKGGKMAIFRQCERYCHFAQIGALVLATNAPMGMPETIAGKPIVRVPLGLAWL